MTRENVRDEDTLGAGAGPCLCAARDSGGRDECRPRVSVDEGGCCIGELLKLKHENICY